METVVFSAFMEPDSPSVTAGGPAEDAALLSGLRAGEETAFEQLVAAYGPRMRATALRLTRNEADANDVVQEAFLHAIRGLDGFRGNARIGTWLHRIAVNAALMRVRAKARRPEVDIHELLPRFGDGGNHLEPAVVLQDRPDQRAARGETAAIVRRCIDELPANYRIALILKDIEDLEYQEIADQLGLTLNATRIRIHRARQALRKLLVPRFGEMTS